MAQSSKKPRAKPTQKLPKTHKERVKESRVTKPAKRKTTRGMPPTRTRAKTTEVSDEQQRASTTPNKGNRSSVNNAYYTSLSQELRKTPKIPMSTKKSVETPKTPPNSSKRKSDGKRLEAASVWDLLDTDRSFWDHIKETSSNQTSFGRTITVDDVKTIMSRLNRQVSHQFNNYKVENYGNMLASSIAGLDSREENPTTVEQKDELLLVLWPSIQHLAELTKCQPHRPNPSTCYLEQFRALLRELQDIWQDQGHRTSAPALFQLEAWKGGISNWRSSAYTNGDERIPASIVEAQFQKWCAEMPSPPSPTIDPNMPDDVDPSDLEMQSFDPTPYFHSSRPLHTHRRRSPSSSPTPQRGLHHHRRRAMSAIYDNTRDIGFLPTAAQIHAYQTGESSSTTIPGLRMSDPGIIDADPPDPIHEAYQHRHWNSDIRIFESEDVTSPPRDDGAYGGSPGSASSDKENDGSAMERVMEELRRRQNGAEEASGSQDDGGPEGGER